MHDYDCLRVIVRHPGARVANPKLASWVEHGRPGGTGLASATGITTRGLLVMRTTRIAERSKVMYRLGKYDVIAGHLAGSEGWHHGAIAVRR